MQRLVQQGWPETHEVLALSLEDAVSSVTAASPALCMAQGCLSILQRLLMHAERSTPKQSASVESKNWLHFADVLHHNTDTLISSSANAQAHQWP